MKKSLLFSAVLAGLMLGSCSSSDDLAGGNNPSFNKDGNGFMSVSVNLPTRSSNTSRAVNDNYDDGEASEYEVKNGILALFDATGKASEGEYTLLAAYKLDLTGTDLDTDKDNITSTHSVVTQIKSITATDVYALVLLNDNSILTVNGDGKLFNGTDDLTSKTYKEILALTTDNEMTGTGFFMANAPVSATPGNASTLDGKYTTLSKVDVTKIKETKSEAINDPAVSVFVERGVAKVSLNSRSLSGTTTDNSLPYTFNGWVLDNTTKSSYIVRNMGPGAGTYLKYSSEKFTASPKYRFVGEKKLGETTQQLAVSLYRTYWCVDPTYDKDYDATNHATNFKTVTSASEITDWLASDKYVYCHENTFDVDHMNYQNTTRALVKATFNNGADFYTNNGDDKILASTTDRDKAVMSYVLNSGGINIVALKDYLTVNQAVSPTTWDNNDFELSWAPAPNNKGILEVTDIKLSADGKAKLSTSAPEFTGWDEIKNQLNDNRVIRKYVGGASYYEVRIKHFADDLAPWNDGESSVAPSASLAYPGNAEQNYLGRYGLVRNNWYDIDVTAIKKIGSPVVPDITTDNTPDDNIDAYISAKINVLSWAKRTQSTILGK